MSALLNRVVLRVASIVFLAVLASAVGQAQSPPRKSTSESARDLAMGTWVMNRDKSSYRPGPVPLAITRTYEPHPDGVKVTIETVTERGKSVVEFVAEYDSMEYPVKGSPDIMRCRSRPSTSIRRRSSSGTRDATSVSLAA